MLATYREGTIELYRDNRFVFISLVFVWIISAAMLLFLNHGDEFYYINPFHSPELDVFFKYLTDLGNGLVQALILLPLLFFRFRVYAIFIASHLSSGLFAQIIKFIVDASRPHAYFSNFDFFHTVAGVSLYSHHSFPSGHTASIFALSTVLCLVTNNKWLKFLFLLFAIVVAFSRMYLLQHFLLDVYFGSIIGVLFGVLTYLVGRAYIPKEKLLSQTIFNYIQEKRSKRAK